MEPFGETMGTLPDEDGFRFAMTQAGGMKHPTGMEEHSYVLGILSLCKSFR